MKPKTIKLLYWIFTILFATAMLMDGIGGVTQQLAGKQVMQHLGYPMYFLIILGIAKLAGVLAILQSKYVTIKEWAFAGFTFNFLGAFGSRLMSGDSVGLMIPPIIMLIPLFALYFLWKKVMKQKGIINYNAMPIN